MSQPWELKPCPFCGAFGHSKVFGCGWTVGCSNHSCKVHPDTDYLPTAREAIVAWNTRAEADSRQLYEALKQLMKGGDHEGECVFVQDQDGDMFCRIHSDLADTRWNEARAAIRVYESRGTSLLRPANTPPPEGCHCQRGKCMAPMVMGRQMPCRDPRKRDAKCDCYLHENQVCDVCQGVESRGK